MVRIKGFRDILSLQISLALAVGFSLDFSMGLRSNIPAANVLQPSLASCL